MSKDKTHVPAVEAVKIPEVAAESPEVVTPEVVRPTKARALIDVMVDGRLLHADALVEADADVIAELASSGQVDPHPDAVAYIEGKK